MELHCRKPNRLKNYDYSMPGGYFITICSLHRKCIFWNEKEWDKVKWKDATLSLLGKIVDQEIQKWSETYVGVKIDKYVIMPNHIHVIVIIKPPVEEECVLSSINSIEKLERRTQFVPTISRMVKQFKGSITKQVGNSIWQKSFYDHVIRDEKDYERIWEYIENNPYGCIDAEFDWV